MKQQLKSKRLEIRPLLPSDYQNAVTVYRDSPGFIIEMSGHAPEEINSNMIAEEAREAQDHDAMYCGIYLSKSGKLVGITTFEPNHHSGKTDTAWIALLMISELFQHKGYGIEAYEILEEYIFADPVVDCIELGVLTGNEKGRGFWQAMGYRPINSPEISITTNPATLQMRKPRPGEITSERLT